MPHSADDQPAPAEGIAHADEIVLLPIDSIRVLNPRSRNRKVFARLVENVATVGLERPITVARAVPDTQGAQYDLVCGQGRLEAFKALGERDIPCVVVQASESDRYLMSLVENIARRRHSNRHLLEAIQGLAERGYSVSQIEAKLGLNHQYVSCALHLLKEGETRVIDAVESGLLSVDLALTIARLGDAEVQQQMMVAYEAGTLRGDQLMRIRKLVALRQKVGKGYGKWRKRPDKPTTQSLLQAYQAEARRQQLLVKKADLNQQRLIYLTTALRRLLAEEHFRTLLRAEGLYDMPTPLADLVGQENEHGKRPARL